MVQTIYFYLTIIYKYFNIVCHNHKLMYLYKENRTFEEKFILFEDIKKDSSKGGIIQSSYIVPVDIKEIGEFSLLKKGCF